MNPIIILINVICRNDESDRPQYSIRSNIYSIWEIVNKKLVIGIAIAIASLKLIGTILPNSSVWAATIQCKSTNYPCFGTDADDTMFGDDGDNFMSDKLGNDVISGKAGDDVLVPAAGKTWLMGTVVMKL